MLLGIQAWSSWLDFDLNIQHASAGTCFVINSSIKNLLYGVDLVPSNCSPASDIADYFFWFIKWQIKPATITI